LMIVTDKLVGPLDLRRCIWCVLYKHLISSHTKAGTTDRATLSCP
jgi:hypothetical protein